MNHISRNFNPGQARNIYPMIFAVIASIAIQSSPVKGIAVVVNQQSDSITLVDVGVMKAIATIPVGGGPHEAAVSKDGKRAVVTNYFKPGVGPSSSLSLLDLNKREVIKTIKLQPGARPHDVRWTDENHVVVSDEAHQELILVDITIGKVTRTFKTEQPGSHMLSWNKKTNRIYSSNMGGGSVTAFEFSTANKLGDIACGKETEGVGVTLDGKWIWAGNRQADTITIIDAATLKVAKTMGSVGFPYRVQFTPNGKFALIPHAVTGQLVVFDVAKQEEVKRINVGKKGVRIEVEKPSPAGVWPCKDSKHALVTVRNDNSVLLVNLETGRTMGRVEVGSSPDGVSMQP